MEQGHEKGSAFAICVDAFKRAGKPIFVGESEAQKLHLFCEAFRLKGNRVSGVAIHPKRIFHPEEGMTHVYLREELEKAAPTLVGKPFGIDHRFVLPPPNVITKAWYCKEENGVCFEGVVDDQIAKRIRRKEFKGISIELDWLRPGGRVEYVDGVAARNFELTSVHFLTRFPPGDKDAYVKLWEQITTSIHKNSRGKEQLVVAPALPLDQRVEALEQQLQEIINRIDVINARLDTLQQATLGGVRAPSPLSASEPSQTVQNRTSEKQTESIAGLRKRLAEVEARLAEMIKRQVREEASWKNRYEKLRESIRSAIPPSRVWKSWTLGPQRYVQENLKILRETESWSQV
jgi:chaperonin cofactor prefoldin